MLCSLAKLESRKQQLAPLSIRAVAGWPAMKIRSLNSIVSRDTRWVLLVNSGVLMLLRLMDGAGWVFSFRPTVGSCTGRLGLKILKAWMVVVHHCCVEVEGG